MKVSDLMKKLALMPQDAEVRTEVKENEWATVADIENAHSHPREIYLLLVLDDE